MTPQLNGLLTLAACLMLASCGGPGKGEIKRALEDAWAERADDMATMSGLNSSDAATGVMAGVVGATPKTIQAISHFNGMFGEVARDAAREVPELAARLGVKGADTVNARMQRSLASGWRVTSLEIEDERRSDEDIVARLRYTLSAETAAGRATILTDAEQVVRLEKIDGRWVVQSVKIADR
jgi:hypothetical protein